MNAQIQITPTLITADHDGQITLALRESLDSCVVVRLSESQALEVIFALEDALNAIPTCLTGARRRSGL